MTGTGTGQRLGPGAGHVGGQMCFRDTGFLDLFLLLLLLLFLPLKVFYIAVAIKQC